jgi:hypothetical protein
MESVSDGRLPSLVLSLDKEENIDDSSTSDFFTANSNNETAASRLSLEGTYLYHKIFEEMK